MKTEADRFIPSQDDQLLMRLLRNRRQPILREPKQRDPTSAWSLRINR